MPPEDDRTCHRACIMEIINDDRQRADEWKKALIKFKCLVNDQWEEVVAYNHQILDFIEQGESWVHKGNVVHKMKEIAAHKGPLKSGHPEWKGSLYNVKIIWWDGSTTWEPVTNLVKDDPVMLAAYMKKNNLQGMKGWWYPTIRAICEQEQKLQRTSCVAKICSNQLKPVYQYGFLVPRNHAQAMQIDDDNGNTQWRDSEVLELSQIDEYDTFIDKGKGYDPGPGYKQLKVHFVYAVKHDG
jgi:hypothetical protein